MARLRKPFQGVWNIIRFNWPFYVVATSALLVAVILRTIIRPDFRIYIDGILLVISAPMLISLAVSFYVYDVSGLYTFAWLPPASPATSSLTLLTINAGFDEASRLLQARLQPAKLLVFDFFDPDHHTEASIRRARQAYPAFPGTQHVSTSALPLPNAATDQVIVFFAAHEIREEAERMAFFRELRRVTKPAGQIIITEHLRNPINFLAYSIGFLHFHSRPTWLRTFRAADLRVQQEIKITPFVTTFILVNRGATA